LKQGQDAWLAWESLIRGGMDQVERDKMKKALLDYCQPSRRSRMTTANPLEMRRAAAVEQTKQRLQNTVA
jgi:hypothetical protein